ncbi:MAG TPA: hypothetical protein DCE44_22195, partial [Verrucomicrobiales bacterium]|nr:hypothetical protein [Verrucomicrobiales bacterium]
MRISIAIALFGGLWTTFLKAAPIPDAPFWQDVAVRIRLDPKLDRATFKKVCVDRENVVYVLSDRGVARVFDDTLALDRSFRPLADRVPLDLEVSREGDLYYLFSNEWLSNDRNGRIRHEVPVGAFSRLKVNDDGTVEPTKQPAPTPEARPKAPWAEITCRVPVAGGAWFGSTRGAFFERTEAPSRYATPSAPGIDPPRFRYYAGPRWLRDDHVVDLTVDRDGNAWILTKTGLNQIAFRSMTLAAKADWFQRKVRSRNLRFGLTAERRMTVPGDLTTSELVDTDNDGGWTSYYLGALAAEYAVTKSAEVRRQAWDSFGALERLREISTVPGFFARTLERRGFKFSDTDRWRPAEDPGWEWKGHTSSDEMCSQTFAHAVMWELVATNAIERARIAKNYVPIIDHILEHNLYLVDVDGKPTLWGRWNPEYVNWFPPSIVDRRLNSAELIASLQLAFTMTGKAKYREKAEELFRQNGYLTNILRPMKLIAATPGFIHEGNDMGDEWNHSDDELAFFTYWVLVRFAFSPDLRAKYLEAVADHWAFERPERYPIWNFIYAACGGTSYDPAGAVWTLRGVPLDTINWPMKNSHRGDLTKRETNFMHRELEELLPPGERLIARINTQPFILDAGDGSTDFPGDEFL